MHGRPSRWRQSRNCLRVFHCCTRTNQSRSPWPWSARGREDSHVRDQPTSPSQYDKKTKKNKTYLFDLFLNVLFSMCVWFVASPPVDIVRACSKTGGSSDPDHITEERHQEASDRLHGPSSTKPGSSGRPHREFYHVSRKKKGCGSVKRQCQVTRLTLFHPPFALSLTMQSRREFVQVTEIAGGAACGRVRLLHGGFLC